MVQWWLQQNTTAPKFQNWSHNKEKLCLSTSADRFPCTSSIHTSTKCNREGRHCLLLRQPNFFLAKRVWELYRICRHWCWLLNCTSDKTKTILVINSPKTFSADAPFSWAGQAGITVIHKKPSTSSCLQTKWRELLYSLWSLALEASQGQTHCYPCHTDEAPSSPLVRGPPRRQLLAQTPAPGPDREVKGSKTYWVWYPIRCGNFCIHVFAICVYSLKGFAVNKRP